MKHFLTCPVDVCQGHALAPHVDQAGTPTIMAPDINFDMTLCDASCYAVLVGDRSRRHQAGTCLRTLSVLCALYLFL
jgi:hypothetical protein